LKEKKLPKKVTYIPLAPSHSMTCSTAKIKTFSQRSAYPPAEELVSSSLLLSKKKINKKRIKQ